MADVFTAGVVFSQPAVFMLQWIEIKGPSISAIYRDRTREAIRRGMGRTERRERRWRKSRKSGGGGVGRGKYDEEWR